MDVWFGLALDLAAEPGQERRFRASRHERFTALMANGALTGGDPWAT
jgi:hypothetical protein